MSYKNKQCEAITKKGAQCASGAMPNEDYCGPHLTQHGSKKAICQVDGCNDPQASEVEALCQTHIEEMDQMMAQETEVPDKKKTIYITITGHRPNKLGGYDPKAELNVKVGAALERKMLNAVEKFTDDDTEVVFRIGMAIGVDQMAAWICVRHNLPFDAYTPCDGQENRWPKKARDEYRTLLTYARNVYKTHDGNYPGAWVLHRRNEQMIDGVDGVKADYLLSVYDGTPGGTAGCVAYARGKGVTEVNINPTKL